MPPKRAEMFGGGYSSADVRLHFGSAVNGVPGITYHECGGGGGRAGGTFTVYHELYHTPEPNLKARFAPRQEKRVISAEKAGVGKVSSIQYSSCPKTCRLVLAPPSLTE